MLFIENSYLKNFNAKVLNIDTNKIILDQTAFYAKSGGQPGDTGQFIINENKINIIDTIKDEKSNICHISEDYNKLKIGQKVEDITKKGKPIWNGEDIIFNVIFIKKYKKEPKYIEPEKDDIYELPGPYAISKNKNNYKYRKRLSRIAYMRYNLFVKDDVTYAVFYILFLLILYYIVTKFIRKI